MSKALYGPKRGFPPGFPRQEAPFFCFHPVFSAGGCVKVSGGFLYKLSSNLGRSQRSHFKGVITVTVAKRNIDEARVYFARVGTDLLTPTDEAVREIQNKLLGVMTNKLLHTDMPCSPPWKICSSKGRPYSIITGLMAGTNMSYRLCQMNRGGM